MADEKSCIICFEASSKDKDYVTCPYCSFECCKKCLKRFILEGIGEAYCMNVSCKKYFTRSFLGEAFGLNWIARATEGSYKSFIKAKQLEAQKAKLPEIMNYMKEQEELKNRKKQREIASQRSKTLEILIEPYRKLEEDIYKSIVRLLKSRKKYTWGLSATYDREGLAGYGFNHFHDLIMEILKNSESSSVLSEEEEILEGDVTDLKIRKKLSNDVKDILLHPTPALTRKIKDYFKHKDEMDAMSDELESLLVIVGTYDIARYYKREEDKTPVYTYIQGCPSKDCRGLIEKKTFKCSLCDIKICKKCRVEKTSKSEGKEEEGKPSSSKIKHECKKEDLESVALIKSDSKPCPKCATAIFKISGCSQMFCTNCHIAFDWNSGRIDNGTIHNPHYFEFLRNKGISQHDNNVCGDDVPTYTNLHRKLLTPLLGGKALRNRNCWIQYNPIILSRALSMIEELRVQINWMERKNRDSDDALMKVGVRYLTKQIEEHDWERKIYEINEKVSKNNFMIEIYNSLRMILTEAFRKFYVDLGDSIASFLSLSLLEEYVKKRNEILAAFMSYLEEIRKYFNDSIIEEYKKTSLKKGSFNVVGPYWDIMSYTEIQKGLRRPGSFGEESLDDLQHTFANIGFRGRISGPVMRHLIGSDTMNHTPDDLFSSEESSDEY